MRDAPSDPGQPPRGQEAIDRRAWPRDKQARLAALLAVVVIAALAAVWLGDRLLGRREALVAAAPAPPGTFRATPQQLKSLTIEPVALHGFVSEELTEGKIAVNGDRATPVFSPYSGRVTRVIAGLGDTVKSGAPLATLDASEFVQAQNDLSTTAAQLKIARISEARKHALYDAKGGSLQDWQQAQADLTAAETARGSVRNRLKILGKSDPEIDALEAAHVRSTRRRRSARPSAGWWSIVKLAPASICRRAAVRRCSRLPIPRASGCWPMCGKPTAGLVRVGQAVEVHVLGLPEARVQGARDLCRSASSTRSRTACRCAPKSITAMAH